MEEKQIVGCVDDIPFPRMIIHVKVARPIPMTTGSNILQLGRVFNLGSAALPGWVERPPRSGTSCVRIFTGFHLCCHPFMLKSAPRGESAVHQTLEMSNTAGFLWTVW